MHGTTESSRTSDWTRAPWRDGRASGIAIVPGCAVIFRRPGCARSLRYIALSLSCVAAPCTAQGSPFSGTTTFVLNGNRIYAVLSFVRPDGSLHEVLAYVDMGTQSMIASDALFRELGLNRGRILSFRVGDLSVRVPAAQVSSDPGTPFSLGSHLKVEAVLPAGVLQKYEVVIDYQRRTLTLAQPGTIAPRGDAVPFRLNEKTGLIAVDATIAGKSYPVTIDNGSAYTWFRQDTVKRWLSAHPDWERGRGAVGPSNMMMSGDGAEASGILLRIPEIVVGPLALKSVGALGAGRGRGLTPNMGLFDWYATKNVVPVVGWIGGNVLKNFRLTIDYPRRTLYWHRQMDPDTTDLDQVGLTLQSKYHEYIVSAVATKNGEPTVLGVSPGDKLVRVGGLETANAKSGALFRAMHGKPGETRVLVLERGGHRFSVPAKVTAF